jgi:hypothetical protein
MKDELTELQEFMDYLDTLDAEKIKKENQEFHDKKTADYKELNLRYERINLKQIQKKYTTQYVDESIM